MSLFSFCLLLLLPTFRYHTVGQASKWCYAILILFPHVLPKVSFNFNLVSNWSFPMSGYQPVDGKTGDRVAVLPPPVLHDNFSGYHPSDGLYIYNFNFLNY
jgi:hypothetical protein